MKYPIFTGSGTAVITPFTPSGIDREALRRHIRFQIENGTDAIIVCGTTGEASAMSDRERAEAIACAVEEANGQIPIIAGTGSNNTETAVAHSRDAVSAGADGILVVTPGGNKATQQGLIQYYLTIADSVDRPIILYNVPSRTGVCAAAETYRTLAGHPNILGVKEASGNLELVRQTRLLCPEDFYIWSGNDEDTAAICLFGGKGVISVASNIVPQAMHDLTEACLRNDLLRAGEMQVALSDLIKALFCEVNPIPVKTALAMMGRCQEIFRLPMCPMAPGNRQRLEAVLRQYGLIL